MAVDLVSYSCCIQKKKKARNFTTLGRAEGKRCPCWLDVNAGLETQSSAPLKV